MGRPLLRPVAVCPRGRYGYCRDSVGECLASLEIDSAARLASQSEGQEIERRPRKSAASGVPKGNTEGLAGNLSTDSAPRLGDYSDDPGP